MICRGSVMDAVSTFKTVTLIISLKMCYSHSFIPLAYAECDDSLMFSGASSLPLCYILSLPLFSTNYSSIFPHFILPSISFSLSHSGPRILLYTFLSKMFNCFLSLFVSGSHWYNKYVYCCVRVSTYIILFYQCAPNTTGCALPK
jgi:hypothetical protein